MLSDRESLTPLEACIVNRLAERNPSLRPALPGLLVLRRDYTGAGSYTYFMERPGEVARDQVVLDGYLEVAGLQHGLGAAMFLSAGKPWFLEIFTFGSISWDGTADVFVFNAG
ncbi:MAG: hypothetical protein U1E73_01615 [Planctomycetota bacterium]